MANRGMPTKALPRLVVIKSVFCKKFLCLTDDKDKSLPPEFVKFEGLNVVIPAARFELETPKSNELAMDRNLKHIRCIFNNKYLVKAKESSYIVLQADKPQEDMSNISCTLFKVEEDKSSFAIRHVQSGKIACFSEAQRPLFGGMSLGPDSPDGHPLNNYILLDWDNVVVFPKGVRFKGDNGKYIRHSEQFTKLTFSQRLAIGIAEENSPWPSESREIFPTTPENYQEFVENTWNDKSEYEVTTVGDGYVRIKSLANGMFWRLTSGGWIRAESSDQSSNDQNTLFWPIKTDNNKVALQNMANKKFCKRHWSDNWRIDALNAGTTRIEDTAKFVVEELVSSRKVYDIQFDLLHKRVYNERIVHVTDAIVTNSGSQSSKQWVGMEYKNIKSNTWNTSTYSTFTKEAEMKIPDIPKIDLSFKLTSTETTRNEWVETESDESKVKGGWYVTVPARTKMVVSLIATQASCEIPFSYTRSDVLTNGETEITTFYDGVYTLDDYFNQDYEIKKEESLDL